MIGIVWLCESEHGMGVLWHSVAFVGKGEKGMGLRMECFFVFCARARYHDV